MVVGRLAPTPSGDLHLGNALAFGACWLFARAQGGTVLLRNEDIDTSRARASVASGQREDLLWLGLDWDQQTPDQSTRTYAEWVASLDCYWCSCTRKSIAAAGGHKRCSHDLIHRIVDPEEAKTRNQSLRFALPDRVTTVRDLWWGQTQVNALEAFGDPVLLRRDGLFTYPLAVVVDDHRDGVTQVVRGADLLKATAIQIELSHALGLKEPTWRHTPVLLDGDGRKLSKSLGSTGIRQLRQRGVKPADVWARLLPHLGLRASTLLQALDELRSNPHLLSAAHPSRPQSGTSGSCPERQELSPALWRLDEG